MCFSWHVVNEKNKQKKQLVVKVNRLVLFVYSLFI